MRAESETVTFYSFRPLKESISFRIGYPLEIHAYWFTSENKLRIQGLLRIINFSKQGGGTPIHYALRAATAVKMKVKSQEIR